jgi:NAD/NADP transhydrogenase alpha subunit
LITNLDWFSALIGIAMLVGAGFFGYMLALLQRRLGAIVESQDVSA